MIRLAKSEINKIVHVKNGTFEDVAQAQLKKVVGWLKEHSHSSRDTWHQEIDKEDWQALLKEVGKEVSNG